MFALPFFPGTHLPAAWGSFSVLHALFPTLLFLAKGMALSQLDSVSSHDRVIGTDGSVPFSFGKVGYGVLANCSLCDAETTFLYLAFLERLSFSAKACAILLAFCWSGQHQQDCLFFNPRCYAFLSSVLPSISHYLAGLCLLFLYHQATVGAPVTHFFRAMTQLMSWPGGVRCSNHPLFYVVSLLPLVYTFLFFLDWRRAV